MPKSYDIISIGSSTHDVFLHSKQWKIFKNSEFTTGQGFGVGLGSKIEMDQMAFASGGGGTNAAVTFARQGLETACIGVVGKDANGNAILEELKMEGVEPHFQIHDDGHTAYSVILVDESAERSILSYKGEGQHFDASKLNLNELSAPWLYLDSLGGHYDVLETALKWATENNVKIATDPGGKEYEHGLEKLKPLFQKSTIVHMNQEEASMLTGIDYKNEEEIFKFMDKIVSGVFLMTKGPDGVAASDGKNIYRAAVPDSPVVERTGAGDSFTSGFVVEYMRSSDVAKAIQFGTANASSVVTQYGSKAGILKKDDWGPWPLIKVESIKL